MKKILALVLTLVMMVSLLAGCGSKTTEAPAVPAEVAPAEVAPADAAPEVKTYDKPEMVLKFAETNADTDNATLAIKNFADLVFERTNGKIQIDVYSGGQLGNEADTVEQERMGAIDFVRFGTNNLEARGVALPEFTALALPYLFASVDSELAFYASEDGQALLNKIEEASGGELVAIGYTVTSPRNIFTKELVTGIDDLKGMKIRAEDSELKIAIIAGMGASATPLAFNDLYSSLQTGVVDGGDQPIRGYYSSAFYEVCPYMLETGHNIQSNVFTVSGSTWNKLSAEDQEIIKQAMADSCAYFQELQNDADNNYRTELEAKGVTFTALPEEDLAKFQEAMQPLYEKYAADYLDLIALAQSF